MTDRRRLSRAYSDKTFRCDGCLCTRHVRPIPPEARVCQACWFRFNPSFRAQVAAFEAERTSPTDEGK